MKKFLITLLISFTFVNAFSQYRLVQSFPNLSFQFITEFVTPVDGSNRIFVTTQTGKIYVFQNSQNVPAAKLFLTKNVNFSGEMGLLGMAFDPDYHENGFFYIMYNTFKPMSTIISRYKVSAANPDSADVSSEEILLEIPATTQIHKGGKLMFGIDGLLYIGIGDGGGQGDPLNNAQNLTRLYGKILRIDVSKKERGKKHGLNYSIPESNPFAGNTKGYREEIFSYGMRNPWKFSQDPITNRIWEGDVGNNIAEEINIIESGVNYGWKIMEGYECFFPSVNCDTTGLRKPVIQYLHSAGEGSSVTGGYVYRGTTLPGLYGKYIFADFISGNIWKLNYDGVIPATKTLLLDAGFSVSTFGVDSNNELYVCNYGTGKIYHLRDTTVGININSNIIPESTALFQNYPNPFNPNTKIRFTITKSSYVKLSVFDIQGREIQTLLNEILAAGDYSYSFNPVNLPSGTYIYRLETNGFVSSKRMVLLK